MEYSAHRLDASALHMSAFSDAGRASLLDSLRAAEELLSAGLILRRSDDGSSRDYARISLLLIEIFFLTLAST